jgi:arylsulfatase A-like enzyme
LAGLPVPADMQGKSLAPVLAGKTPDDWRKSMYYRYYHDPGDHNTRAHYGVRTTTHKLIHYWKKDAWELFDLQSDPHELRNLYGQAGSEKITASLQSELKRLRTQLKDEDQFSTDVPKETSRGEPLRWAEGFSPQGPKVPRP